MRVDYSTAEPYLDDARIGRIEGLVRLEHPTLPDDAQFVSARVTEQHPRPCGCCDRFGFRCPGGEVPYVHLLLIYPMPKVPPPFLMQQVKRAPLALYQRYEKERQHYASGGMEDPALWSFQQLAADAMTRITNAAEMTLPEDD